VTARRQKTVRLVGDFVERARWRKQAVAWLRADLEAYGRRLQGKKPQDRALVCERLRGWLGRPEPAGLRVSAAMAGLPADERDAFERLWADVRAMHNRAAADDWVNPRDG
jgi:eukaryotic-like serine/threonine-protein kinase